MDNDSKINGSPVAKACMCENNSHFKCNFLYSLIICVPNQRRQVYIHSWPLSAHSSYDFQMHFNVPIFSSYSFFFHQTAYLKIKIPVVFWHFNANVPDRNVATVPRLGTKKVAPLSWKIWVFLFSCLLTYSEERSVLKRTATSDVAWRSVDSKPGGAQTFQNQVLQQIPSGHHQSTSAVDEQQVALSKETHKVELTDVWSTTSLYFFSLDSLVSYSSHRAAGPRLTAETSSLALTDCNYVEHAYRLLCKMPLKHLHSAKVHIRELSLKPAELSELHPVILSPPAAGSGTLGKTCCRAFPRFCLCRNVWCERQQGAIC